MGREGIMTTVLLMEKRKCAWEGVTGLGRPGAGTWLSLPVSVPGSQDWWGVLKRYLLILTLKQKTAGSSRILQNMF